MTASVPSSKPETTTGTRSGPSLTHRAARGALLGSIAAVIDRLNALAVGVALTYILLKEDFGLWSLALPIMGLAAVPIQSSIRDILINRADKFNLWSNPAAWLSTTMGAAASLSIILMGIGATYIYDSPKLFLILLIASIQQLAGGFTTVHRARMSIDMRFGALAAFFCVSSLSNWILALVFALLDAGVYAFPLGIAVTSLAQILIISSVAPVKLKLNPQIRRWKFIINDTGAIVASNFARWIRTQGDRLILGLFLTQGMLGVYFLAFQLSIQTFSVITLNLASVLLPTLGALNKEPERQANAFVRSVKMLLFMAAPICVVAIVVATPVVRILYDENKWEYLDTTFQLITAGMIFRAIEPPVRSLMNAQGRFYELFILNLVSAISFCIVIFATLYAAGLIEAEPSNIYAAAIAGTVFHIFWAMVLIRASIKNTHLGMLHACIQLAEPVLYAIVAGAISYAFILLLPTDPTLELDIARIASAIAIFIATYILIAHTRRPNELNILIGFALKMSPSKLRPLANRLSRIVFNYKPQ